MDARHAASPKSSGDRSLLTRSPLSNRANMHVDKANSTNWEHKDSSEDQPSTHDSVCDAAWISTSDLAKSPYQTPGRPVTPLRSIDIDLESESPLSRLETPFLYGYGTELAPILEQRSIATLRTMGSRSTSDLSSLMHDAPGAGPAAGSSSVSGKTHSKSDDTTTTTAASTSIHSRPLRRKHSSSLTDDETAPSTTTTTTQTAQALPTTSSTPQLKRLSYSRPIVCTVDIHAYPRRPIYPPPQRPTTPPSLRRIPRPKSEGNGESVDDAYVAASASGRVAYAAPGFRPPRSGHGNLATHPFLNSASTATAAPISASPSARAASGGSSARRTSRQQRGSVASPDVGFPTTLPETTGRHSSGSSSSSGACKKCRHPRGERWSLGSTLVGRGPGMRRGADWCGRCACRKIARGWCCGE
ncbi:hypothetical protein F4825DRAFT_285839 [Nemania diffusa]|nr:hypothetical protein F4825DRAFT_285839 [Nemania diffusa]